MASDLLGSRYRDLIREDAERVQTLKQNLRKEREVFCPEAPETCSACYRRIVRETKIRSTTFYVGMLKLASDCAGESRQGDLGKGAAGLELMDNILTAAEQLEPADFHIVHMERGGLNAAPAYQGLWQTEAEMLREAKLRTERILNEARERTEQELKASGAEAQRSRLEQLKQRIQALQQRAWGMPEK